MILDNVHQCWWCKRLNTITEHVQRYWSPVVMRVEECVDKRDCHAVNLRRKERVGAR